MTKKKNYLNEALMVIISCGFLTGLSHGWGVKIPSEGDLILLVYNSLNQTVSSNAFGNSQTSIPYLSQMGPMINLLAFFLAIIPLICAVVLFPWGVVLLIDSIIAGYSLGLYLTNSNQILMWIGIIAMFLFPVFSTIIYQSKNRNENFNYDY
jgi:hypothetical protein